MLCGILSTTLGIKSLYNAMSKGLHFLILVGLLLSKLLSSSIVSSVSSEESVITITSVSACFPLLLLQGEVGSCLMVTFSFSGFLLDYLFTKLICVSGMLVTSFNPLVWISGILTGSSVGWLIGGSSSVGSSLTITG